MLSDLVAAEVVRRRKASKPRITREGLAARCAELGAGGLTVATLESIETGRPGPDGRRRRHISVDEWLVLAKALNVPPLLLVCPVGQAEHAEVLPDQKMPTWPAAKWITGEAPFPVVEDGRAVGVTSKEFSAWCDSALKFFREEDAFFEEWSGQNLAAELARKKADLIATAEDEKQDQIRLAKAHEKLVSRAEEHLRRHRATMRAAGITPRELTANLRHVDADPPAEDPIQALYFEQRHMSDAHDKVLFERQENSIAVERVLTERRGYEGIRMTLSPHWRVVEEDHSGVEDGPS